MPGSPPYRGAGSGVPGGTSRAQGGGRGARRRGDSWADRATLKIAEECEGPGGARSRRRAHGGEARAAGASSPPEEVMWARGRLAPRGGSVRPPPLSHCPPLWSGIHVLRSGVGCSHTRRGPAAACWGGSSGERCFAKSVAAPRNATGGWRAPCTMGGGTGGLSPCRRDRDEGWHRSYTTAARPLPARCHGPRMAASTAKLPPSTEVSPGARGRHRGRVRPGPPHAVRAGKGPAAGSGAHRQHHGNCPKPRGFAQQGQ